jgi:soluble lytic murein transglycosylase-like protein
MSRSLFRFAALLAALLATAPGVARADDTALLCEAVAARAGAEAGLPPGLMPAIARVESGKGTSAGRRAWPWTLNQGGKGSYHPSREAALTHLEGILATGTRNVDLGCMQLNWRWHGDAFPDAATMIDPVANTRYAAGFLRDLHARHGSWSLAIAHYHSNDPARGKAYAAKVAQVLDQIGTAIPAIPAMQPADCAGRSAGGDAPGTWQAGCPRLRGILVVADGGLLGTGKGRDLRMAPPADTAATPSASD